MTTTDAPDAPAAGHGPEAQAILDELAQVREQLDAAKRLQDAAQDTRLALWQRGLALPQPLTRTAMGAASGLSAEYITKALRPKGDQVKGKRPRPRA